MQQEAASMELRVSGKGQKDLTGVFFPAQLTSQMNSSVDGWIR